MNYSENTKKIKKIDKKYILQETKHQKHKLLNNDIILKLQKCNYKKESEQVRQCASYLVFSHQEHIKTSERRLKLKSADFCKFRFCSTCNWRRNLNIARELLQALEAIEAKISVNYLFLTLTIRNPDTNDLKRSVKHLNESFKRMSKTKRYKDTILGHFKALEILGDMTVDGEVHPHFHIILIVNSSYFTSRNYISQAKWIEMWQKALRVDYTPVVDVRRIKPKKTKNGKEFTALQSAVFEVAKYSVKHTELIQKSDKEFITIIEQTKNMRFFATGGILKKQINFQKCNDELIHFNEELEAEWKEIEELVYEWKNGNYYLK